MRVLVIAYYFPPEGGAGTFRTLRFVRHLRDFGIEPVVLTVRADRHSRYSVMDATLLGRVPSGIEVIRTDRLPGLEELLALRQWRRRHTDGSQPPPFPGYAPGSEPPSPDGWTEYLSRALKNGLSNLLTTPDYASGWLPFAVARGLEAIRRRKITCLYSTGGPWTDHLVGATLHQITGLPWVADFRDPWTSNIVFGSIEQFPFRAAVERRLEQWVLSSADRIVTVSQPIRQELLELRPRDPEAIRVITNAFEGEEFDGLVPKPRPDVFTLSHIGRLYANRCPRRFCAALRMVLARRPDMVGRLQVEMVGRLDPEHYRAFDDEGVADVVVRTGPVPRREALQRMVSSDALLLLVHDAGDAGRGMYTGKLFEYLASGRSILAIGPPGVARDLVESLRAGITMETRDIPGIAAAIEQLFDRWDAGGWDALSIDRGSIRGYSALETTRALAELLTDVTTRAGKAFHPTQVSYRRAEIDSRRSFLSL